MDTFERLPETDANMKKIFELSKSWLQGKKLTPFNLMEFVSVLIPMVQKVVTNGGQGSYKKKLIMSVLDLLIEKLKFGTDEEEAQLSMIIHETVPSTIDLMINISKGNVNMGKDIIKIGKSLFSSCFGKGKGKKKDNKKESSETEGDKMQVGNTGILV
jgi:hypothetical protein